MGNQNSDTWAPPLAPVIGGAIGWLAALWLGLGPVVHVLAGLMIFDFITGILFAGRVGELSSAVGISGLRKKAYTFSIVLLLAWLQSQASASIGLSLPAADVFAGAMALLELTSILENYQRAGGNLGPLKSVLAAAKGRAESP